jgi:hypothetical protein
MAAALEEQTLAKPTQWQAQPTPEVAVAVAVLVSLTGAEMVQMAGRVW